MPLCEVPVAAKLATANLTVADTSLARLPLSEAGPRRSSPPAPGPRIPNPGSRISDPAFGTPAAFSQCPIRSFSTEHVNQRRPTVEPFRLAQS